jgi:DNA repair protein RadC
MRWPLPRRSAIICGCFSPRGPYEVFVGLFLDSQNRLLAADELFRGTLAQTSVYPREVVKAALAATLRR